MKDSMKTTTALKPQTNPPQQVRTMTASTLLQYITNNDVVEFSLSKDPDDYFENPKDLVDAMKQNTSVEKVTFDEDFLACCNGKDRKDIVEACGTLLNVKSVVLKDSMMNVGVCIVSLVTNAKKLNNLTMENCVLHGGIEDFEALEKALKGNTCLKTLRIVNCSIPNVTVQLDKVIESYKALPIALDVVVVGSQEVSPKKK
jgi:hypothetical protein